MRVRNLLLMPAVLATLATFGCGDQNQVGNNSMLSFSPPPVASPKPSPRPVATKSAATQPVQNQHPVAVAPKVVTVSITASSPYFSPANITVSHTWTVKFVNKDAQPDFIQVSTGSGSPVAKSPTFGPGGSWTYTFTRPGSYQITDRRPYATGSVTSQ